MWRDVRVLVLLFFLLSAGAPSLRAEEEPPTEAEAIERVARAHTEEDAETLTRLAALDVPDPWIVAEELCRSGRAPAAAAFAARAVRPATETLAAYVERRSTQPETGAETKRWDRVRRSFAQGSFEDVVAATETLSEALRTVLDVRCVYLRGVSLLRMNEPRKAVDALLGAARGARGLGWIGAAVGAYGDCSRVAAQCSCWDQALAALTELRPLQVKLGQTVNAARSTAAIGFVQEKQGAYAAALETQEDALEQLRSLGDEAGAAKTLGNIGIVHMRMGSYPKALTALRQAVVHWQTTGNELEKAIVLVSIGLVQEKQGAHVQALATLKEALKIQEAAKDLVAITRTLANLANVLTALGDYPQALWIQERVLGAKREFKDQQGEALTLSNIGVLYWSMADYPQAIRFHRRALALRRKLGDRLGEANSLGNLAVAYQDIGDFAEALRAHEAAIRIHETQEDRIGLATARGNLGRTYLQIGRYERAEAEFEQALATWRTLGNEAGVAGALAHLGIALRVLGDLEESWKVQREALTRFQRTQNAAGVAGAHLRIGMVLRDLKRYEEARTHLETARKGGVDLGDGDLVARAEGTLGLVRADQGDPGAAIKLLEGAVRRARELHMTPILVRFLGPLSRLRLERGDAGRALAEARSGLDDLEKILGGLGEEEGALARERFIEVFSVGARAAVALDEPEEAFLFLESGRAGSLLDALRGRRALLWTDLPEHLRTAEAEARTAERRARIERDRQLRLPDSPARRQAFRALAEAVDAVQAVAERIQREAKHQAGIFYPRATQLATVRKELAPGTAFLLYGLCGDETLALVATAKTQRWVRLGKTQDIVAACDALAVTDPAIDPEPALERLRALLIEPLDLPKTITQVLVSPDGRLSYLPFCLLLPKRTVGFSPSGTTHVLLRKEQRVDPERRQGTGVLAIGNAIYGERGERTTLAVSRGHGDLGDLPATKAEVEAVGSVTLLGPEATEAALRKTLATQPRWRAVHFACHGVVDTDRPTLSALALTRAGEDDGFLTCLEILRMRIPADLVVLSACSTARGRLVRAEGVVGLMRAFMYAGSPRILCSLWKVDDKATKALMTRFYELWAPKAGPGLPPAEALRKAQAHVAQQPGWAHPYYWAAWTLWGLPE